MSQLKIEEDTANKTPSRAKRTTKTKAVKRFKMRDTSTSEASEITGSSDDDSENQEQILPKKKPTRKTVSIKTPKQPTKKSTSQNFVKTPKSARYSLRHVNLIREEITRGLQDDEDDSSSCDDDDDDPIWSSAEYTLPTRSFTCEAGDAA